MITLLRLKMVSITVYPAVFLCDGKNFINWTLHLWQLRESWVLICKS